jgi:carboxyl-terminal processing protease
MKQLIFLTISIIPFFACSPNKQKDISNTEYVKIAFDSIEFYSLQKNTYNFDSLEITILGQINDSTKAEHIIELLNNAVNDIDIHSYVLRKSEFRNLETGKSQQTPFPFHGKIIDGKYAMVSIDGFLGVDSTSSDNYADSLQNLILNLYLKNPIGWIIDLRNNTGGWEYPMIAGLGPILGEGILAYEVNGDGKLVNEYSYARLNKNGVLTKQIELIDSAFVFDKKLPTVVLVGNNTGSAGEFLTQCFYENTKTVLIGEPTFGVPTGLRGFFMPDSTQICVTSSIVLNRNKKGNGKSIIPDIIERNKDKILEKAFEWIFQNQ